MQQSDMLLHHARTDRPLPCASPSPPLHHRAVILQPTNGNITYTTNQTRETASVTVAASPPHTHPKFGTQAPEGGRGGEHPTISSSFCSRQRVPSVSLQGAKV